MLCSRTHGLTTAAVPRPRPRRFRCRRVISSLRYSSDGPRRSGYDVAVLGGGISGLAAAYYITRDIPTAKVTIFEASSRLGGWLQSKRIPVKDGTVLFEAGVRSLRPSGNGVLAGMLLQELDLAKDAIFAQRTSAAAKRRYIYYPDHLVCMPHPSFGLADNLWSMMTEPVFKETTWAMLTEVFKDQRSEQVSDESVGDFFSRRLSQPSVDRILSAVLHGIYAGDAYQLSAKSLFPTQWRDELKAGSIVAGMMKTRADGLEMTKQKADFLKAIDSFNWDPFLSTTLKYNSVFTFRDGLGMLADRISRHLMATGNVTFRASTPVCSITPSSDGSGVQVTTSTNQPTENFSHVISTLPPSRFNNVGGSGNARLIPDIPAVTVMVVNLYYRTPNLHPEGFGYLIPRSTPFENNPERALGVVFDDAYSPSTDHTDMSKWGINDPDILKREREMGRPVNVNDFAWYNMPSPPNIQDDVPERGTKVSVMIGGHWWDGWPAYPDEYEGLKMAKAVMARHLGVKEEPEAWQVSLQKDCIPQYTVGHEARLMTAHNNIWRQYRGKVRVAGNWISGVGLNDCLRSSWEVVRGLREGKDATGLEHIGQQEFVRYGLGKSSDRTNEAE